MAHAAKNLKLIYNYLNLSSNTIAIWITFSIVKYNCWLLSIFYNWNFIANVVIIVKRLKQKVIEI